MLYLSFETVNQQNGSFYKHVESAGVGGQSVSNRASVFVNFMIITTICGRITRDILAFLSRKL